MLQREATGSKSALRSPLPLIAMTELRMGLRAGIFRFAAVLLFALGWSSGSSSERGAGMSAYATGEIACRYLGVAAVLWVALGAVRDTTLRTDVLVFTKPQPPERLALARFLGLYGQILCLLCALFVGASVGHLWGSGSLMGLPAYGIQYLRSAGALFFAAAASYCLALLADSAIAGVLIGLYWVVAMAGREFLAKFYYPWYWQNLPAYLLFGVSLLAFALWFSRRRQRGSRPVGMSIRVLAPTAALIGSWLLYGVIRNGHDTLAYMNPALERMSMQNIVEGEMTPGFLLPDQNGKPTYLSQFSDRILLIALWSPSDPDSLALLERLEVVGQRYREQGVQPVAICLCEDASAPATFAIGDRISFPLVYDWGTSNSPRQQEASPLAIAYQAVHLPRLIVTDRRHRIAAILDGLDAYEGAVFDNAISRRLTDGPD